MPLKQYLPPGKTDFCYLPLTAALPAFIIGCFCIIAPLPQLVLSKSSIAAMLLTACIGPICGILLMTVFLVKSGGKKSLNLSPMTFKDFKYCFGGTFLIIFTYALVNALWKYFLTICQIPFAENQYLMLLAGQATGWEFFLLAILVTFPVPIAEELLFRRILFAAFLQRSQSLAWFGTAAVFAAVHLFLAGLPGLFIIGLGFQYLYISRQNLAVSIFSHSLLNACAVLAAWASRGVLIQ